MLSADAKTVTCKVTLSKYLNQ